MGETHLLETQGIAQRSPQGCFRSLTADWMLEERLVVCHQGGLSGVARAWRLFILVDASTTKVDSAF